MRKKLKKGGGSKVEVWVGEVVVERGNRREMGN